MRPQKIIPILLVIVFLAPWFAPLAHSFTTQESSVEQVAHFCEISNGPCKHGDACPLKDQHHKDSHSEYNKTHRTKHTKHTEQTKTGKDNVDGKTFLASQCHNGEAAVFNTSFHLIQFTVASTQLSPHRNNINQSFIFENLILYNDTILKLLERPPQNFLYHS